ncbi:MAG: hypothetical protein IPJ12_11095 [Betaproteobacteria bacterium]|nr:hypothetical protein [Betaproteobacteria bacterium]
MIGKFQFLPIFPVDRGIHRNRHRRQRNDATGIQSRQPSPPPAKTFTNIPGVLCHNGTLTKIEVVENARILYLFGGGVAGSRCLGVDNPDLELFRR